MRTYVHEFYVRTYVKKRGLFLKTFSLLQEAVRNHEPANIRIAHVRMYVRTQEIEVTPQISQYSVTVKYL